MQRLVRAQALDLAVLQRAQQFGLHAQGQFADFIQEQRAAIGRIEATCAVTGGTGKRPFDVTEQFTFGQGFRQRCTVHLDQGLMAAPRQTMQATGEQLLADTGLAQQQDGQIGVGQHIQFVEQMIKHLALPEDLAFIDRHVQVLRIAA
ncbi:hypothetical protein D3C73_711770 [compost metagenome]